MMEIKSLCTTNQINCKNTQCQVKMLQKASTHTHTHTHTHICMFLQYHTPLMHTWKVSHNKFSLGQADEEDLHPSDRCPASPPCPPRPT